MSTESKITIKQSKKFDTGTTSSSAVSGNIIVEIHKSNNNNNLYYHVGIINDDCEIDWGNSTQYDKGVNPDIAMNEKMIVEVHKSGSNSKLYYHIGQVNSSAHTIKWSSSVNYDKGTTPSIGITENNTIVEMHKSGSNDKLYYHEGKVLNENTIDLGDSYQFEGGIQPSVSCTASYIVQTHQSENNSGLWASCTFYAILTETVIDCNYDPIPYPENPYHDMMVNQVCKNPSAASFTTTFKRALQHTATFQYTMTKTLHTGSKVEFEAKIPFIGSTKTEISVDMTLESQQSWSSSTSETYEVCQEIDVPANTSVEVLWYIDFIDNLEIPYHLQVEVTGTQADHELSSDELKKVLLQTGCTGEITDGPDNNSVTVELSGTFIGSYGMNSNIEIENI